MRGFLTSCRKEFTTQAQVILMVHLLKLGDRETKEGIRMGEATGESLGDALLLLPRNVTVKKEARVGLPLAH